MIRKFCCLAALERKVTLLNDKIWKFLEDFEICSEVKSFALEILSFDISNFKKSRKAPEILNIEIESEKIDLKYNQVSDVHLVVKCDAKPGDVLAQFDFFVAAPEPQFTYSICANCSKYTFNGIPCEDCAFVIFLLRRLQEGCLG